MLKEFLDSILKLVPPTTFQVMGRTYTDKPLIPAKDPVDAYETVNTLTGFAELVEAGFPTEGRYIHVLDHATVTMMDIACTTWGHRTQRVRAVLLPDLKGYEYGRFMGLEAFIISLMSLFESTDDREAILRQVSKITDEQTSISEDDGISQKVTVKSSVSLKGEEIVKRIVTLAPYRTFREIDQPQSQFVFRVRKTEEGITCALFEADGGKWRLEAMQRIKVWLAEEIAHIAIVA